MSGDRLRRWAETEATIAAGERQPLLAGAQIIFDKTGRLPGLIARAGAARPRRYAPEDVQQIQFLVAHAHDKVARALETDPAAALFAMHTGRQKGKAAREHQAVTRLFGLLPPDQADELWSLWREFEARDTPEAAFASALDRLMPLLQFEAPESARVRGASVTFAPGARTAWHTHPLGQTLIVTAGCGWAQREGGPVEEIRPGDVVWFAPGEKHWHGANQTTATTHIALQEALDGTAVEWMEQVSDEQYQAR